MHLAEDDLLLRAMDGAPRADAPLQRPANAAAQFGMAPEHLLEDGDRPKAGGGLQHRHDLGVEDIGQRIGPAPSARRLLLRGQPRILLDAIGRGGADRRLRRRDGRRIGLTELHVEPHLVIGYMAAGHKVIPPRSEKPPAYPAGRDHQTDAPYGTRRRRARNSGRATPSLRSKPAGILILIVAPLPS